MDSRVAHMCGNVGIEMRHKSTRHHQGWVLTCPTRCPQEAAVFAEKIGLELIATLKHEVGDLDKIKRIVKVVGFVNCIDSFGQQPEVLNGCSNLFGAVFGDRGVHARSAVGTNSLPRQVPVEIEIIAEVSED